MGAPSFPVSCEGLTAQWLTDALGGECELGGARVAGFDAERVGTGSGFLGVVNRLTLAWDRDAPGAPKTLIAKFPSPDPGARLITTTFRHYEHEVLFYEHCAQRSPVRTARAYFQAYDPESGDFALLLEDLAPARPGDHVAGLAPAEAALAVRELARLQAAWWESEALHALGWLAGFDAPYIQVLQDVFLQCWGPYRAFFGERLSPEVVRLGEKLGPRIRTVMRALTEAPCTLVHGDYRADNFFFDDAEQGLAVVDWQICLKGRGAFDLAYLLCGNLSPADRRTHERELVRLYSETLAAAGVAGYGFEDAWRDYRTCAIFGWIWPVIAIGSLDPTNERGMAFFNVWNERFCAAIQDLEAGEVLDQYAPG